MNSTFSCLLRGRLKLTGCAGRSRGVCLRDACRNTSARPWRFWSLPINVAWKGRGQIREFSTTPRRQAPFLGFLLTTPVFRVLAAVLTRVGRRFVWKRLSPAHQQLVRTTFHTGWISAYVGSAVFVTINMETIGGKRR